MSHWNTLENRQSIEVCRHTASCNDEEEPPEETRTRVPQRCRGGREVSDQTSLREAELQAQNPQNRFHFPDVMRLMGWKCSGGRGESCHGGGGYLPSYPFRCCSHHRGGGVFKLS